MGFVNPKEGQSHFQWNAGGWFGAFLGSTTFMLVGGLMFACRSTAMATVWLVCYATAVTCGILLWTRRKSFRPFQTLQCLLLVVGMAATIAILSAFFNGVDLSEGLNATPTQVFLALLVVPGLMLGAQLLERRAT
jgi:tryptophan-rich sensory protein